MQQGVGHQALDHGLVVGGRQRQALYEGAYVECVVQRAHVVGIGNAQYRGGTFERLYPGGQPVDKGQVLLAKRIGVVVHDQVQIVPPAEYLLELVRALQFYRAARGHGAKTEVKVTVARVHKTRGHEGHRKAEYDHQWAAVYEVYQSVHLINAFRPALIARNTCHGERRLATGGGAGRPGATSPPRRGSARILFH